MPRTSLQSLARSLYADVSQLDTDLLSSIDENICQQILDIHVENSYLSHWKSSIETLILANRQRKFKETIKKDNLLADSDIPIFQNGLYKILIRTKTMKKYGMVSSDSNNAVDIICINNTLTPQESRCVIAHELGHLIIERFLKENDKFPIAEFTDVQKEQLANLFMYYILWDKSNFYKNNSDSYIFEKISDMKILLQTIIDTFQ